MAQASWCNFTTSLQHLKLGEEREESGRNLFLFLFKFFTQRRVFKKINSGDLTLSARYEHLFLSFTKYTTYSIHGVERAYVVSELSQTILSNERHHLHKPVAEAYVAVPADG